MSKKLTRQQAINEHCKQCIYDDKAPGTWRMQVKACTVNQCPLYDYRPLPYTSTQNIAKDS